MDTVTTSLDRRGKTITTFVVFDAASVLETMAEGDSLEILTDEFAPFEPDIAAWCQASGHVLRASETTAHGHRFVVEKGSRQAVQMSMAMIISNAGLEELLSPLGFALGAALEGIAVSLYFQGPAVRVLSRGYRPRLHGWARPFSRFAAAGMTKSGHIPAQAKLQQLRSLGARLYACGGSMQPFKVRPEDFVFDDIAIVEYLSFMAVMRDADIQLYV